MQQYKENSLLHCQSNFAYVSMPLCCIIHTLPIFLKLRKRNCSNCTENIRHHCIKFSCLANRAPEICAPLHDVAKQDQHHPPTPRGDKFVVACWMLCLLVVGLFWNTHDSSPVMTFTMYCSCPVHSRCSDFGFFICDCGSELRLSSPF